MIRSMIGKTIGIMMGMMVLVMGLITVPANAYAEDARTVSPNNSAFENRRYSQNAQDNPTAQQDNGDTRASTATGRSSMNEAVTTGAVTIILFIIIALVLTQGSKSRYKSLTEESERRISQDARADNLKSDEEEDALYHRVRDKHQAARAAQQQADAQASGMHVDDTMHDVNTASTVNTADSDNDASTANMVSTVDNDNTASTVDNADSDNNVDNASAANTVDNDNDASSASTVNTVDNAVNDYSVDNANIVDSDDSVD